MSATNKQWDINTNIGVTAVAVAAARAAESQKPDALISDPYAHLLVSATDTPVRFAADHAEDNTELWNSMTSYLATRTHFLDEFFEQASAAGVTQAVILASGLDTRAYRMSWPEDMHLFEIDLPKVLEFKETVLHGSGVRAQCQRHSVPVDLRDDWASALAEAGFTAEAPSAWLGEGLLPYLPAAAEAQLLSTVDNLSAPGSRIALEHMRDAASTLKDPEIREHALKMGIDVATLMSDEPRPDAGDELARRGWKVERKAAGDLADELGRDISHASNRMAHGEFITAAN